VFHETEKVKLQLEVASFQKEQADVTSYYKRLAAEWAAFKQRLSKLYGENLQYADELTRLQIQSAAQINRRAASAAAPTPPTP
jgi:molecular chaperone GrpE (heat shock protein)